MNEFVVFGEVTLGQDVFVGRYCVLACPKEDTIRCHGPDKEAIKRATSKVRVGDKCIICNYVSIYEGTDIGPDSIIEDNVHIGYDCRIGRSTRITYGAYICDRVVIGDNARIAGFICDASKIGNNCTVMGNLIHEYTKPHMDWWDANEPSPVVHDCSVIGFGAIVVGGVEIGPYSYVAAGAIVTKRVPPKKIVVGVNKIISFSDWKGRKLPDFISKWRDI